MRRESTAKQRWAGALAGSATLVAIGAWSPFGCASVIGLDDLQKVDCLKDCGTASGGQPGQGGTQAGGAGGTAGSEQDADDEGNVFNLACTSRKQCLVTEFCCGRHELGTKLYTSKCEQFQECVLTNGTPLCDPSTGECSTCVELPSFPGHTQCD
ncbi:MAG: hypothetical protein HY898_17100 [Deltaproteobacteria bacterium]|nr:hypothetical protein [Deltaproteobacteria bacterium]